MEGKRVSICISERRIASRGEEKPIAIATDAKMRNKS